MARNQVSIVAGMLFFLVMSVFNTAMAKDMADNPIDQAFTGDFMVATSTVEINYVAEKYREAWKTEMVNVAAVIKRQYKFPEDQARIDSYTAAYEQAAAAAGAVEWLNWSDTEEQPENRWFGTGAVSASLLAEANIYKQATLNLINAYQGSAAGNPDGKATYTYGYAGQGAELEKIRQAP